MSKNYLYNKYEELKLQIAALTNPYVKSLLERELGNIMTLMRSDPEISFCECCGQPLCPEDDRCYNVDCDEYDPFSQYFD